MTKTKIQKKSEISQNKLESKRRLRRHLPSGLIERARREGYITTKALADYCQFSINEMRNAVKRTGMTQKRFLEILASDKLSS